MVDFIKKQQQIVIIFLMGLYCVTAQASGIKQCHSDEIDHLFIKRDLQSLYRMHKDYSNSIVNQLSEANQIEVLLGLAAYRIAELELNNQKINKANKIIGKTIRKLKRNWHADQNVETGAILSLLYGMQMNTAPHKRLVNKNFISDIHKAIKHVSPNNPRLMLANTINKLQFENADEKRTVKELSKALNLLASEELSEENPCWGTMDAYLALLKCADRINDRKIMKAASIWLSNTYPSYSSSRIAAVY